MQERERPEEEGRNGEAKVEDDVAQKRVMVQVNDVVLD
jgi:hypothetical protein